MNLRWSQLKKRNSKTRDFLASWRKQTLILLFGKAIMVFKLKLEITWPTMVLLGTTQTFQFKLFVHKWICTHLRKNIVSKVRSEVDCVMTTVENRVQDAVLTAIENIVIARVELAMKSANACSGLSVDVNVLAPYQRDFLGNIEDLQLTASNRINSRTDLIIIDETRGEIIAEGDDLLLNERNIDRQTYTHHTY